MDILWRCREKEGIAKQAIGATYAWREIRRFSMGLYFIVSRGAKKNSADRSPAFEIDTPMAWE